ncbi:MAG TPA: thioredoxin domain-containing protein [Candidatus Paceibacterota bacterium]|nr:thioredoxin domain-containing protein [Candidatus Paceibacterota bacterium]
MKSQYVLPITIVVAGLLIAGAVFLVGKTSVPTNPSGSTSNNVTARPYDASTDHILGNPNAQVKVVEYMDLECPHCKAFETTMDQIMNYYGTSGNVAWVQRPFPLASIHSKAPEEAEAAECAADLGGNTAYWKFVEGIFAVTPSNNGLDLAQLPVIAGQIGLDVNAFNACLSSNKFAQKVTDSYNEAIGLGAQGTPFTLVMVGDQAVTLSGDQPYDSMRAAIDAVLQNNGATASTTTQ